MENVTQDQHEDEMSFECEEVKSKRRSFQRLKAPLKKSRFYF